MPQGVSCAHAFRLGAAYTLWHNQLLLAVEFYAHLHGDANKRFDTWVDLNGDPSDGKENLQPFVFDWRNSYGGRIGLECLIIASVPLRLGYTLANSATPAGAASAFAAAPGLLHAVSGGAGLNTGRVRFDLAGAVLFGSSSVAQTINGPPGDYSSLSGIVSFSGTYQY